MAPAREERARRACLGASLTRALAQAQNCRSISALLDVPGRIAKASHLGVGLLRSEMLAYLGAASRAGPPTVHIGEEEEGGWRLESKAAGWVCGMRAKGIEVLGCGVGVVRWQAQSRRGSHESDVGASSVGRLQSGQRVDKLPIEPAGAGQYKLGGGCACSAGSWVIDDRLLMGRPRPKGAREVRRPPARDD